MTIPLISAPNVTRFSEKASKKCSLQRIHPAPESLPVLTAAKRASVWKLITRGLKQVLKKFRNPIIFALILLPIALIGGFFTSIYLEETYDPALLAEMLKQAGISDIFTLHIITAVQIAGQMLLLGFFGYILDK